MFMLIGLFGAVCFALGAFFAALILNTEEDNHEQKTRRLHLSMVMESGFWDVSTMPYI